jgi:polyphosphate kinase 2 (PPK2 family)
LAKGKQKKKVDLKAPANDVAAPAKMPRKEFEQELSKLQVELTRLQAWAVAEGARVIVVFEGRDTAGKGGVISRIMQRCSPRVFKHVALPKPSDREKSQLKLGRQPRPPRPVAPRLFKRPQPGATILGTIVSDTAHTLRGSVPLVRRNCAPKIVAA